MTAPACPYELGEAGLAWWTWAWTTPQSKRWDAGALYSVARRALLEDDMAALVLADDSGLLEALLDGANEDSIRTIRWALGRLSGAATGNTGLSREMRELEGHLGLSPKAMAALQWKADDEKPKKSALDEIAERRKERRARASGT